MRRTVRVLVIVTLVASGLIGLLWSQQRRLVYFPSSDPLPSAAEVLPNGRDVALQTTDGLSLTAWYFPVGGGDDGGRAVLVLPGNGGDRSMRVPLASALNRMGMSVLLVDYRGFGGNPGRPSEQGLAADARAAQEWLAAQAGVDEVVYFGESLGAAVAVELATEHPPSALVLRSPFTSLGDAGAVHYPWLPVRWLLMDRYPSLERIAAVRVPVLVVAGDRDDIVPASMSRRLFEAANEPKRWLLVPGAGHNDLELLAGPRMLDEIGRFLSEHGTAT
ncbi:alpha/beta hydrolase [Mycobacterium sp. IDR2000157661]|uniref:alpha/beta hydrolase n=1 Tax=Mycobacterium sp. IDR2000157661 TaxID=2867005 RepID=UPI001EEA2650|nr:alpha/beta hydrolase [Mycobacterium sp. IDR2000157661]ULE34163.1 alpha/beta hydrolase [Mycobacterium sp. IDR2000157661]